MECLDFWTTKKSLSIYLPTTLKHQRNDDEDEFVSPN